MKPYYKLGVAGFVLSGVLAGYLESKSVPVEDSQATDVEANPELREMGRELGAAMRPEAMFDRLRGAGSWLRQRSTDLSPKVAHAAAATPSKPAPSVRSPKRNISVARNPEPAVRSSRRKMPKRTVWPRVASAPTEGPRVPSGFSPTGPTPSLGFQLHRFLVGQQVLAAGLIDEKVLKAEEGHGKYLVYLDLSVTNQDARRGCRFSYEDLRLQGSRGLVYTPVQPRDGLRAYLEAGQTRRGGVAFSLYNDSAPARLLYRTGPESFDPVPEGFFFGSHNPVVSQAHPASPTSDGQGEFRTGVDLAGPSSTQRS